MKFINVIIASILVVVTLAFAETYLSVGEYDDTYGELIDVTTASINGNPTLIFENENGDITLVTYSFRYDGDNVYIKRIMKKRSE